MKQSVFVLGLVCADWIALCQYATPVCACTASGCGAGEVDPIAFDFHVSGSDAMGSVQLMGLRNVYLTH